MRYFDHDTHAADDDAIMALRLEHGSVAIDCYWTLLEKMYRDESPLNLFGSNGETNMETKSVSHRLCIGCDELKKYVSAMLDLGLFNGSVENLFSDRAMKNIASYQARVETARQNGKKGGRKPTRKPKANRVGSNVETDNQPSGSQEKKRKGMGLLNVNPIPDASGEASADGSATPSAIQCPTCDAPMERTAMRVSGTERRIWRCPLCMTEVSE